MRLLDMGNLRREGNETRLKNTYMVVVKVGGDGDDVEYT
jgi:hypothetical protein